MNRKSLVRLIFLLLVTLSQLKILVAQCTVEPFPPYPPSPPEFKKGILARASTKGVYLSWEQIPDQEGFLVSVCRNSSGFRPLTELEENSLLVTDIPESGIYTFQVKAFVKVNQSYVFNGGTVVNVQAEVIDQPRDDQKVSSDTDSTEIAFPTPPKKILDYKSVDAVSPQFPGFDGSRSFYNSIYPEVLNPLVPAQAVDGSMIPALLTDEGIEVTVARVYAKKGVQLASNSGPRPNSSGAAASTPNPVKQSTTGDQKTPKVEVTNEPKPDVVKTEVNPMTPVKDPVKIPTQTEPANKQDGSESKSMGAQQGLFLLVGVLILGVIFFLFRKESQ